MNRSKLVFLSIALTLATSLTANAQALNSDEKNTLATIAAIDKAEILVSVVAENKKVDSDVTDYAKMMVSQHGNNLTQILNMDSQSKAGALSSSQADQITQQSKQDLMKLGALQGKDFSIAYANAMVKGHEGALKLINDKLMKTAQSDEMKNFLTSTRSVVEQHLEHAKKLQSQLLS